MTENKTACNTEKMIAYQVGDSDQRPWGHYKVTGVGTNASGEEYCEKEITVNPGQILSMQSHELRRETWTVKQGVLTVLLDGERITLTAGESVKIPLRAIHCMANLGTADCVVYEMQEGACREEDVKRYLDPYGRQTESTETPLAEKSIAVYKSILSELGKQV